MTYDAKTNSLNWTMDAAMHCFVNRDLPYIRRFIVSISIPNTNVSNCSKFSNAHESNWTKTYPYDGDTFVMPEVHIPPSIKQFCMTVKFQGSNDVLQQQSHMVTVTNSDAGGSPPIEPSSGTASPTSQYSK